MNRRRFIQITIVGGFAAAVGAYMMLAFRSAVRRMIAADTAGLKIEEGSIDRFIADAEQEFWLQRYGLAKRALIGLHTHTRGMLGLLPFKGKYLQYRSEIVGQFMLSTDYFYNKMDDNIQVNYAAFFNPHKGPCANPFSSAIYPA
jgi:hypothetical protein